MAGMTSPNSTLSQVAEEFPSWTVFRSNAGRWWASLRRELTRHEMESCDRVVDADDLAGLAEKLREQERRQAVAARDKLPKPRVRAAS
ncbi:hypothetical protein [Bailinhaonella thermotolerans]|uniref:Uncharacterized protein n=1 Tax=Bailinhaonella thermotolerans TaxID=1070861 RepID=A0A3A4AE96_9ACTN|nr:hypothetical protein [Bailinhaonella thermotolerans]RJL23963.1 hypothetical protein D5H75_31510 [Bailinhaonella thermotolerans]